MRKMESGYPNAILGQNYAFLNKKLCGILESYTIDRGCKWVILIADSDRLGTS